MSNRKETSALKVISNAFFYPDRSGVIPRSETLLENIARLEKLLPPALLHKLLCRVVPATQYAEETKHRWMEAEADHKAAHSEMCGMIGSIREWDVNLALLLSGWQLYWRLLFLAVLSRLIRPVFAVLRKTPKGVQPKNDYYSTLLSILLATPLTFSLCQLAGINPRHGLSPSQLIMMAVIAGVSIAFNVATKLFIADQVRGTRGVGQRQDGTIEINRFPYGFKDGVIWMSVGLVIIEMIISAPGAVKALSLSLAKSPVYQLAAILSGGLGGLGNQMIAFWSGCAAKEKEILALKLQQEGDAVAESRTQMAARAYQLKQILPSLKKEARIRKRQYKNAHRSAWRVYKSWSQQAHDFLNEMSDRPYLPTELSNGNTRSQAQDKEHR
jgi:hypothetical protein